MKVGIDYGGISYWDRFWQKVEFTETCWLWTGRLDRDGYAAQVKIKGVMWKPHRLAYAWLHGDLPALLADHLCRVRRCVNPHHIEMVTFLVNHQRGLGNIRCKRKAHCPKGHPYDAANTSVRPNGDRHCRTCNREWWRRHPRAA